ncbi:MAG: hypothetical protein JXB50_04935 [Spirochaetes bacterium]|nr:hypothetical protein [Spirochaetota bacterium]
MKLIKILLIIQFIVLISCNADLTDNKKNLNKSCFNINDYYIKSTVELKADGEGGTDTYALIKSSFGPDCIEAPDLYPDNHPGFQHIKESFDPVIGNHFIFFMHTDIDKDRQYPLSDINKQRNEIKTYNGSDDNLKCSNNEAAIYQWKFFINNEMTVSKKFTHFFQIKAVDGDDDHPIVTLTGCISGENKYLEIRYSPSSEDIVLARTDWESSRGKWLTAESIMHAHDNGYLKLTVKNMENSTVLLSIENNNIDMWRKDSTFNRPKWGIYRGLDDIVNLRTDEETVFFADFTISELEKK